VNRCEEFYARRDRRTNEYLGNTSFTPQAVHVSIGPDAASTLAGQVAAASLVNLLARVHRRITFDLASGDMPLLIGKRESAETLAEHLLTTMRGIDPCGSFSQAGSLPGGILSIGLGEQCTAACTWFIGARNSIAFLAKHPQNFAICDGTARGAALASCLGSAALFRSQLGLETVPRILSAWNYEEGEQAEEGPESLETLNVGRVLMVGAGAVGSCLAYWLQLFGCAGDWVVVDKDEVEMHNLNRSLLFTPVDAGWPDETPQNKCDVIARALSNATPVHEWYDEFAARDYTGFDVVLCLANERGIRHTLSCRNYSVLLHATTGTNWLSQLHRHIPGIDDCAFCRVGEVVPVKFGCSTGEVVSSAGERSDAALPFLSASSGLMLATLLQRLQAGTLASMNVNEWRWDFDSLYKFAGRAKHACSEACSRTSAASIRRQLHLRGRWKHLENVG